MLDYLVVLDFEATCNASGPRPSPQEIIEFPSVLIETKSARKLDEFHYYIKPDSHPVLSLFCTELTGIEQHTVDSGIPLLRALELHLEWLVSHGLDPHHPNGMVAPDGRSALPSFGYVTCGEWDLKTCLPSQLAALGKTVPKYLQRWINLKKAIGPHCSARGIIRRKASGGMSSLLSSMGLELEGRHHSGIDDARNISRVVCSMLRQGWKPQLTPSAGAQGKAIDGAGCSRPTARTQSGAAVAARAQQDVVPNDKSPGSVAAVPPRLHFPLIDIGVNMCSPQFKHDFHEVVHEAVAAGVATILLTGTSVRVSRSSLSVARAATPGVHYATVGVHPHEANAFADGAGPSVVTELRAMLSDPLAVAVGECGLDYFRNLSPVQVQREAFEAQVQLAVELGMPLFCHERNAHDDFIAVLDKYNSLLKCPSLRKYASRLSGVVVHCFTGTAEHAAAYVHRGFMIGLTGTICKHERGRVLRQLLPSVPLERLLLETDAPYMGFVKGRRRSEPRDCIGVAKRVGEVLGRPLADICRITNANAVRFFRLPAAPRP